MTEYRVTWRPVVGDDRYDAAGRDVLVHVWRDGTGEIATRSVYDRWGTPEPLTPAP